MDGSTSTSSTQCSVCLSQHDGPHFGVLACQACSLFFRRTVFERKTYKCQKNNDCDILQGQMMCQYFAIWRYVGETQMGAMRNACKACRLRRCLDAGMRAEANKCKSGKKGINHSISAGSSQHPMPTSDVADDLFIPTNRAVLDLASDAFLLKQYRDALRDFTNGQKSLFAIENPSTIFSAPEYKPLTKPAHFTQMDRGSAVLLHTMCINYFEPFNELSLEKKTEILKRVIAAPYIAKNSGNNAKNENEKTHVIEKYVFFYGYYEDAETMREFLAETEETDEKIEQMLRGQI